MAQARLPLDGIRVLELAQVVAGPFCGTLMAEFGAEVIKTEMPGRGDDLRRLGPSEDGCSYWFAVDNRNKNDIPHSPIMSMADIFADPHYRARGTIIDVPAEGVGTLPQPAVVPRLSRTPGRVTHAGATLGRHTDEILSELLGLSAGEIATLRAEGVV